MGCNKRRFVPSDVNIDGKSGVLLSTVNLDVAGSRSKLSR